MKILIIGSNGFIGKNIASYFANKNNDVFCCDILKFAAKNYKQLDENHPDYNEVFYQKKYDLCINCSGSANVFTSFTETFNDFKLNVSNLAKMLNALKEYNPECKFINISSAAVYGNPSKIPIFEKSELLPVSPYGFHKLISEIILDEYYRIWNIKTCSLRIFSAYGNGLKKQLLYDVIKKILFDEKVVLFGTGEETRDFIHIDDICRAIDYVVCKDNFCSNRINIANGQQIKIKEIIMIINSMWKHNKKIIFSGLERRGDPIKWQADISVLKSYGYEQSVILNDGLERYIEWAKNEILG